MTDVITAAEERADAGGGEELILEGRGPALAVIDRSGWYFHPIQERGIARPAASWDELVEACRAKALGQVWLYPGAVPAGEPPGKALRTGSGRFQWIWLPGLDIAFAEMSPFADLEPRVLLVEVARINHVLGAVPRARWVATGAVTSDVWLRERHRQPGSVPIRPSEPVILPEGARLAGAAQVRWARRAAPAERGVYCHSFDVNAMYLAAASSLRLPQGAASHIDAPALEPVSARARAKTPGYHRLERWTPKDLVGSGVTVAGPGPVWVTSPTLELLSERNAPRVAESWIWADHHRHLESWYRMLRDGRTFLGDGPALVALKDIYRAGVGRLGSRRRAREGDPLHQPYWRDAIVSEANARLCRRIRGLAKRPAAIDVDCLYWLTDTADPVLFAGEIGLPVDDQPGHLHHAATIDGPTARQILSGVKPTDPRSIWRALENLRGGLEIGRVTDATE